MKNRFLVLATLLAASFFANSQTLFTYGKYSVDAKEFIRAYNKVKAAPNVNKEAAIKAYLDLFIISKLKIREAYARGYDTLPIFKEELAGLRAQIINNYMSDPDAINALLDEAFLRSQKDILVSHIFIPYTGPDSVEVYQRIRQAHMDLSSNKPFENVAIAFSADPQVKSNKGSLGYITVFSLPYEFENIVYNLKPGQFSRIYKSSFGYHIFKNVSERKAIGKVKAAQILLAFPPKSDEQTRARIAKLADSLYNVIRNGGDFTKLAFTYSNDYVSNANGGIMKEISTGTYDPIFENVLFGLQKNGDISAPFATEHGYHIVQRIAVTPIPATKSKETLDELRRRLENDPRIHISKERLYHRIIAKKPLSSMGVDPRQLFAFADSLIDFKRPPSPVKNINHATPLFKIGDKTKTAGDFINFAINNRYYPNATLKSPFLVLDEFKMDMALEYYKEHLEEFNDEFRNQMNDFREGNLFFEIMMQQVWNPAQTDSIGQRAYYEKHKPQFVWKNSADAVLFYSSDETTANTVREAIQKAPANWREVVQHYTDRVTVDSGRFETTRIPGLGSASAKGGTITNIEKNKNDNSLSFAYVLKLYPQPQAKTFAEAKGDVISGYQEEMEKKWVAELKKKYPVKVNQAILNNLIKK